MDRIRKLEEQSAWINAEIQRVRGRESQEERKRETRRKIPAGAMVLDRSRTEICRRSSSWPIWIASWTGIRIGRCLDCHHGRLSRGIMKAAPNWTVFYRGLVRAFPTKDETPELPFDE